MDTIEQRILAYDTKSEISVNDLKNLNEIPIGRLSIDFLTDPRLTEFNNPLLALRLALERYVQNRSPAYFEEIKVAFFSINIQQVLGENTAKQDSIPLELKLRINELNDPSLNHLIQQMSPNTPYEPQCNPKLASRIMKAVQKVGTFSNVNFMTSKGTLKDKLDQGLNGQDNLYFSRFFDEKMYQLRPEKLSSRAGGDFIIELNLTKLVENKTSASFQQEDMDPLLQKIYEVKLGSETLYFSPNGNAKGRMDNTFSKCALLQMFDEKGKFNGIISFIPYYCLISNNLEQMDEILTLNFFRFIDEMRKDFTIDQVYIDNFYAQVNDLSDEELIVFLTDIKKVMTQTAEFHFHDIHQINFTTISSIASKLKDYTLNLHQLINELQLGSLEGLRQAQVKIPELFQSQRFIDYLLSLNLNPDLCLYIECLRGGITKANVDLPEQFNENKLQTIVERIINQVNNLPITFNDLSKIEIINKEKNQFIDDLHYILTNPDLISAHNFLKEDLKSKLNEAVEIKKRDIEDKERQALFTLEQAEKKVDSYIHKFKEHSFDFGSISMTKEVMLSMKIVEKIQLDLNNEMTVLKWDSLPESLLNEITPKLNSISQEFCSRQIEKFKDLNLQLRDLNKDSPVDTTQVTPVIDEPPKTQVETQLSEIEDIHSTSEKSTDSLQNTSSASEAERIEKFRRKYNKTVGLLLKKIEEFKKRESSIHNKAIISAQDLYTELIKEGEILFQNEPITSEHYDAFKKRTLGLITMAEDNVLGNHRGWKKILVHIAAFIASAGVGYLAVMGIDYAVNKRFTLFATDTSKQLRKIDQHIDQEVSKIIPKKG